MPSLSSERPDAIEVRGLNKSFRVYHRAFSSLKSKIIGSVKQGLSKDTPRGYEERHILKDIDLRFRAGETVALIGRNGSGKSTLLSTLARIYLPDTGEVVLRGRVGAMLEVGAAFHPELTGQENVLFNATMLGWSPSETRALYPKILEFAELDPTVLDLPVRMYSSGMSLRLAFSAAIYLNSEILLIDEVLAVGDQGFQDKCFAKFEQFQEEGRTIIVVTHDAPTVRRLAHRVVWLEDGRVKRDGTPEDVLPEYLETFHHAA